MIGIGIRFGDPQPAAVVDRHGDRLHDVGLAGKGRDREAFGQRHRLGGIVGSQPGEFEQVGRVPRARLGKLRFGLIEPEIVEVDVSPAVGTGVDQADEDLFASDVGQIDDDAVHVFVLISPEVL